MPTAPSPTTTHLFARTISHQSLLSRILSAQLPGRQIPSRIRFKKRSSEKYTYFIVATTMTLMCLPQVTCLALIASHSCTSYYLPSAFDPEYGRGFDGDGWSRRLQVELFKSRYGRIHFRDDKADPFRLLDTIAAKVATRTRLSDRH